MICVDAESVFHRARFLAPFVYQRGRSHSTIQNNADKPMCVRLAAEVPEAGAWQMKNKPKKRKKKLPDEFSVKTASA